MGLLNPEVWALVVRFLGKLSSSCPQGSHACALHAPSINRIFPAFRWDSKLCCVHERTWHAILQTVTQRLSRLKNRPKDRV